jgi:hypothetical protein
MATKNAMHPGTPRTPQEAFRRLVYGFGVAAMAAKMGISAGVLYNKADAGDDTHNQPTLRDIILVTGISGDMQVLDALDEQFGRAAFDVTPHADISDEALLELLAKLGKETGQFHEALHRALVQHDFTAGDLTAIRGEAFDMVAALMTLLVRLEGLVDA